MLCMSFLTHLECPECERDFPADVVQNLCPCGAPLFARYDLERAAAELTKEELAERPPSLWRYHELLPVIEPENIV